jgi:hypothetical protein
MNKIYGRLMELGVLTPEQGFKALSTGVLPDETTSQDEQKDYMAKREKGLYTPLVGGPKEEEGRPEGSTAPQTTKTIKPIGTKASCDISEDKYSVIKVKEYMLVAQELEEEVATNLKAMYNVKRMSKLQKEVASGIVEQIMANEAPSKWLKVAKTYCEEPKDRNPKRVLEVNKIAVTHQLDNYLASLLLASKVDNG